MRTERLDLRAAALYRGTFAPTAAEPVDGGELPPGWEGLTFPFDVPFADLRPDGTPARDGILPEIDLPRRLYAGEDTVFHRPLRFGAEIAQEARAGSIVEKTGRAGRLVFADAEREYLIDGEVAIASTWHDVFLEAADADAPPARVEPAPPSADWTEDAALDARQLFRFSALTFNTHLVHYDRSWARGVEGLDDLLVHGPLTRILLLDAARRHDDRTVAAFRFRAVAPIFVDRGFRLQGSRADGSSEVLAVSSAGGVLARGTVTWA
ncbi:MaoC family dehydratase N-terminal domain-containing protein [Pseudolysinimonas sp.]|jgi:3-methylfumaryl-CoA hydratase|uniref:FAS1-like dehydratase domain-containing protein n=1 Tax=Pseudolysinimonas sp. TaxID=2680009 RepID=UPI003784FE46